MPNVLIRNVPEETLAKVDSRAARLGLSRNEYLRRQIEREADREPGTVTVEDFERIARLCADLDDEEVMRQAWA